MTPVRETQKKYGVRTLCIAVFAGFAMILAGYKPEARGLILGCLFSVLNFVLIGETIPMKIGKSKRYRFVLSFVSIFLRFCLMAVPLIVAVKSDRYHVISTIAGLFMVQGVIVAGHVLSATGQGLAQRAGGK